MAERNYLKTEAVFLTEKTPKKEVVVTPPLREDSLTVTENGTYQAPIGRGYTDVSVNVDTKPVIAHLTGTTDPDTLKVTWECDKTVEELIELIENGYDVQGNITIDAYPSITVITKQILVNDENIQFSITLPFDWGFGNILSSVTIYSYNDGSDNYDWDWSYKIIHPLVVDFSTEYNNVTNEYDITYVSHTNSDIILAYSMGADIKANITMGDFTYIFPELVIDQKNNLTHFYGLSGLMVRTSITQTQEDTWEIQKTN